MRGYQCLKNIYLTVHSPEWESPITPDRQAVFDQGNRVGEVARERFPGGLLVDNPPWDFIGSLAKTRGLINQNTATLYEAAFEFNGFYARADILTFSKDTQRWKMFEVKSSTKLKDEHIDDIGLQAWIIAKSGLPLEQINLLHLNSECRYPDLSKLFISIDLTQKIRDIYPSILPKVSEILTTIKKDVAPPITIGSYCTEPYECGFMAHCWKDIPKPSIFNLPKISSKKWDLYSQGIISLDDPKLIDLSPIQERVIQVHRTKIRFVDQEGIKSALSAWTFPLVFLDFETINPAIPRYLGCSPYQHVPFQYSVHILNALDGEPIHKEFLHTDSSDPRPLLIPRLIEDCAGEGSIVAYYGKFESDRISEMAEHYPKYKNDLEMIKNRIVDPLPVIRNHVYDEKFNGSYSLKAVAPGILGKEQSFDGMLISNGLAAQRGFEEIIGDNTTEERKAELIYGILEYCKKDTFVMVELVKWLFKEATNVTV